MKSEDLVKSIELEIQKYEQKLIVKNVGYVLKVGDGIAKIYGISDVMYGEFLTFSIPNIYGMALNLESDSVGAILFGDTDKIKEGDKVFSSGMLFSIAVGDDILGRVVSPLGDPLDNLGNIETDTVMPLENSAPKMFDRQKVNIPLESGIKVVDGLMPIGKGQRELIIGDRHTGKSIVAISTLINQKEKDVVSVYVAIGQKQASVARIVNTIKHYGADKNCVVVNASAGDSAALQFLAPYAGCAIAEYFMNKGKDVLIIYDDLSKHAIAYREISLLLRRPPGREAFPGDIFYLHSKLLERAAMLKKGGSMTALPIVETLSGDISAYIPTNIISITDGQIFLEQSLFNSGIRPAINIELSVSRIGGDAQCKAMKQVAAPLKINLAQYREVASFAQFSTDLDHSTKKQLDRGNRIVEFLKQEKFVAMPISIQIVLFYALSKGLLDNVMLEDIHRFEEYVKKNLPLHLSKKLLHEEGLTDALRNKLDQFIETGLKNV